MNFNITKLDQSIINSYTLHFYQKIAKYIPKCIHPNIITVTGAVPLFYCYYLFSINQNPINFQWFLLSLLTQHSFDYLDGIHARNTNQSSKLGSYLDHCLDITSMAMTTHILVSILVGQHSPHVYWLTFLTILGATTTHLYTLLSGTMYFPRFISIGELQVVAIILAIISTVYPTIWINYSIIGQIIVVLFYLTGLQYLIIFLNRLYQVSKYFWHYGSYLEFNIVIIMGWSLYLSSNNLTNINLITTNLVLAGSTVVHHIIYEFTYRRPVSNQLAEFFIICLIINYYQVLPLSIIWSIYHQIKLLF